MEKRKARNPQKAAIQALLKPVPTTTIITIIDRNKGEKIINTRYYINIYIYIGKIDR